MLKPDQGLALKLLKLSVSSDDFEETLQLRLYCYKNHINSSSIFEWKFSL